MSEKDKKTKDELENILQWILTHRDNEDAMNDIAFTAYPHTTKYKRNNRGPDVSVVGDYE